MLFVFFMVTFMYIYKNRLHFSIFRYIENFRFRPLIKEIKKLSFMFKFVLSISSFPLACANFVC